MQEALGEAFGEMFWFEQAANYYELAIKNPKCGASIKALEQVANCRIRLAVQNFQADPGYYREAKSIIEAQIAELRLLMKTVGETAERWSMVGGGYKRLAQLSSGKSSRACDLALKEMETAYDRAWESAKDDTYPLTNALVAKVIRILRSIDPEESRKKLPELIELKIEAARLAEAFKAKNQDDFWASISVTDVNLVAHLLDHIKAPSKKINEAHFDHLVEEYKETWSRYGSARELNSVIEQYAFLAAVLQGIESRKTLSDLVTKVLSLLNSIPER
jgi:hypothetical protein